MFDERSSRKLPLFSDYLSKAHHATQRSDGAFWGLAGCVVAPALLVLLAVGLSNLMSSWLAVVLTLVVGSPVVFGTIAALSKSLNKPRTPEQERRAKFRAALEKYSAPLSRKKLHKELDPIAGQLLEAAAYHHNRIAIGLNGQYWNSPSLAPHWIAMKQQILEVSDDAMEDATMLCVDCIGKPPRSRKDDLKDAVEGFADLAWVDALQNLGQVVSAKEELYVYKSPLLPIVFEPVRAIAEKLKLLAEEVEKRSIELSQESSQTEYPASGSLDSVLQDMRSLHQAEAELDQEQRLGGQG